MNREISDRTILDTFAEDFCKIVDKHAKYIICSEFVAIAHGRSRGTEDIDMILEKLDLKKFLLLHKDLISNGFECIQSINPIEIYDLYLRGGSSARYIRKEEDFPEMEIKFAKDDIDNEQLNSRMKHEFTGLDIYFPKVEEAIAFKEEYLGSEKDFEDAKHLRLVYEDNLDEEYIKKFKGIIRRIKHER